MLCVFITILAYFSNIYCAEIPAKKLFNEVFFENKGEQFLLTTQTPKRSYQASPEEKNLTIKFGSQEVGSAKYTLRSDAGWLDWIEINNAFSRRGLGERLLATVLNMIRQQGYTTVKLVPIDNSEPFYNKYGATYDKNMIWKFDLAQSEKWEKLALTFPSKTK